ENLLHRGYLLSDDRDLCIRPPSKVSRESTAISTSEDDGIGLSYQLAKSRGLQEFDRAYLTRLIQQTNANVTRAAQQAGKQHQAFGKMLKRYHIGHAAAERDSKLRQ